jgi:hypothetical protein
MGTLHAALEWARRGFPVFPLKANGKEPAVDNWTEVATTDEATIRALWTDSVLKTERDYNIGCMCNDVVVIDIDVKAGKTGYADYMQLGGNFNTLTVRTPTGGYHCYFYGPDSGNSSLTPSIDVRSHNGYVVAPGSTIDGAPYEIIRDGDLSWVPPSIERMLRPAYTRAEHEVATPKDDPASIEAAIRFLQSAPPAIEGQRGDETTFITAARVVRELALSVPLAYQLMLEHWNNRCVPPWDASDLLTKVENAAAYGSADHGRLTPEVLFGPVGAIEPPPSVFDQDGMGWGNAVMPSSIRPRPWIMDRALMVGAVTLLLAAGSAGKSSMSIALAAHLALGKDFAGFKTVRPMKTIIYNGEDDLEEQSRRLLAVCMAHDFDYHEVKKSVMLLSAREIKLELASHEYGRVVRNEAIIEQLKQKAAGDDVGLLILDPLVKVHTCDESDNVQMDGVMEVLTDIAYASNIAVLALHHTSKTNTTQSDRVGNMDIARGASAVVNAARIAFTLLNASNQDLEDYGLNEQERNVWVRLDDAKMNMALASGQANWFKREGVKIISGDVVGVLRNSKLQKSTDHMRGRVGDLLISMLEVTNKGSYTITQAASTVKTHEPLWANKTDTDIRKRIETMFMIPYIVNGKTLKAVRDEEEKLSITLT